MASSVGDPFLLASYSAPHTAHTRLRNVYAAHNDGLGAEGHVLAAAQGDGVHILDLSTLHPIVSHTLGPSTVFSCSPVSRVKTIEGGSQSYVYAAMENVQGINPNERGRTVRVWIDNPSGEPSSSAVKQRAYTAVVPHRVSSIVANDELPDNLLVLGENGEVTITDNEVNIVHTHSPFDQNAHLIRSFAFGRRSCSFVPQRSSFKQGVVLVTLVKIGSEARLVVLGAGPTTVTILGDCLVPVNYADIVDISCSQSGFVSILTRSGEWHPFHIDSPDYTSLSLSKSSPPLALRNFTFISNTNSNSPLNEISIISLGSSHVLLAGVTSNSSSTQEIALLLWDLQYGVLLTSRMLPLPSALNRDKTLGIDVHLTHASSASSTSATGRLPHHQHQHQQQALLILGANPSTASKTASGSTASGPGSSVLLVVPYTVPATSTLANALSRGVKAGDRWVVGSSSAQSKGTVNATGGGGNASGGGGSGAGTLDKDQETCLRAMRAAAEAGKVGDVEEAFFAWVAGVTSGGGTSGIGGGGGGGRGRVPYGYEFVRGVLGVVLGAQSQKSSKDKKQESPSAYSPKIVRHLLEKRCVSAGMVRGGSGLVGALSVRGDWTSIIQALKTVNDIPEDHLVALLSAVTTTEGGRGGGTFPSSLADEDDDSDVAMDVDPSPVPTTTTTASPTKSKPKSKSKSKPNHPTKSDPSSPPPLPTVLSLCVTYPTSAPALRVAIRTRLNDARAVTGVLEVLVGWVSGYLGGQDGVEGDAGDAGVEDVEGEGATGGGRRLMPDGTKKDLHGALVPVWQDEKEKRKRKGERVPPLDKLLQFTQTTLDATFLTLLTHLPAHAPLRTLFSLLQPETELTDLLDQLRGPLEPFVKAHRRMVYEAAHGVVGPGSGIGSGEGGEDWRKRRKEVQERVGGVVGVYQVEELVL